MTMTKEEILDNLNLYPLILEDLNDDFLADKDFMLEVIEKFGCKQLRFASKELLDDENFMENAIKTKPLSIEFASKRLRKNKNIIMKAVNLNSRCLQYSDKIFRNDKELILNIIANNNDIYCLKFIEKTLQNDKEFILKIIEEYDEETIRGIGGFLSSKLLDDKDLMIKVMEIDGDVFHKLSSRLKQDEDLTYKYLEPIDWLDEPWEYTHGGCFLAIGKEDRMRNIENKDVVIDILKKHPIAILFTNKKFQIDKNVLQIVLDPNTNAVDDIKEYLISWNPEYEELYNSFALEI